MLMIDNMKSKKINAYSTLVLLVVLMGAMLYWSAQHDKMVQYAAEKYEHCVEKKYHTDTSAWYNEHGEYPVCGE